MIVNEDLRIDIQSIGTIRIAADPTEIPRFKAHLIFPGSLHLLISLTYYKGQDTPFTNGKRRGKHQTATYLTCVARELGPRPERGAESACLPTTYAKLAW